MDTEIAIDEIKGVLGRLTFPARKREVVAAAREQGLGEESLSVLQRLPEQKFNAVEDILSELPLGDVEGQLTRFL